MNVHDVGIIKHLVQRQTPYPSTKADVSLETLIVEYTEQIAKLPKCTSVNLVKRDLIRVQDLHITENIIATVKISVWQN